MAASTRLRLRVSPGAAKAAVVGRTRTSPRAYVYVATVAHGARLGGASRDKIVELAGMTPEEIERRLATAGGQETA